MTKPLTIKGKNGRNKSLVPPVKTKAPVPRLTPSPYVDMWRDNNPILRIKNLKGKFKLTPTVDMFSWS